MSCADGERLRVVGERVVVGWKWAGERSRFPEGMTVRNARATTTATAFDAKGAT